MRVPFIGIGCVVFIALPFFRLLGTAKKAIKILFLGALASLSIETFSSRRTCVTQRRNILVEPASEKLSIGNKLARQQL